MSTPNDGGPAFPQALAFNANNEAVCAGMYIPDACGISIRDCSGRTSQEVGRDKFVAAEIKRLWNSQTAADAVKGGQK